MTTELSAINCLRQATEAVMAAAPPEVATQFSASMTAYEMGARAGLTLDQAFGLSRRGGGGPWWAAEDRLRRDQALRELHQTCLRGLKINDAISEIIRLAERRRRAKGPPTTKAEGLVDFALKCDAKFPKARQLRVILCSSI